MKLSDLKVGDKFRWTNSGSLCELIAFREYPDAEGVQACYWSSTFGFQNCDAIHTVAELITDPPEPKYRPFANAKEFEPHRERWLLENGCTFCRVLRYEDGGLWLASGFFSWYGTLQTLTFDDGTPCGELVE